LKSSKYFYISTLSQPGKTKEQVRWQGFISSGMWHCVAEWEVSFFWGIVVLRSFMDCLTLK